MANLVSSLAHRVDAARQLMQTPVRAAEGSGRLFLAKRCHEAAKAGTLDALRLAAIRLELLEDLGTPAGKGVELEAAAVASLLRG